MHTRLPTIAALHSKIRQGCKKAVPIMLSALLLATASPLSASAASCPIGMTQLDCAAIYGGWTAWAPAVGCAPILSSGISGGITALRGADNEEKIWNFLIDHGLTPYQAAGVMGNMAIESAHTWSPVVHQKQDDPWNNNFLHGFGIVQWDGGRRYSAPEGGVLGSLKKNHPDLVQYASPSYDPRQNPKRELPAGVEDDLLSFELNYLYDESNSRRVTYTDLGKATNEWETLRLQRSIEDATVFWHNNFEVSRDSPDAVIRNRGGSAQEAYNKFNGAGTGATVSKKCDTSGLAATVVAYAWPNYHDSNSAGQGTGKPGAKWGVRKQEYVDAVADAKQNGMYIGGFQGVDCGAFVSLLMVNSGFEPNYNYEDKISNGAAEVAKSQTPWLKANWELLGPAKDIDPADLRPGDVAVSPGHTFVWVGDIPGFNAKIASASLGRRAPMADSNQSATSSSFTWYRKK